MGKIKGWTKHRTDDVWWSEKSSIDIGKAINVVNNKMIGFRDDIYVLNITIHNQLFKSKRLKSRKEARDIAIKYMRGHPNG